MQQVDTNQLIPKASTVFNRIIHFFGSPRISIPQPDQSPRPDRILSNINWPDSDSESGQPSHDSCVARALASRGVAAALVGRNIGKL